MRYVRQPIMYSVQRSGSDESERFFPSDPKPSGRFNIVDLAQILKSSRSDKVQQLLYFFVNQTLPSKQKLRYVKIESGSEFNEKGIWNRIKTSQIRQNSCG